MQVVVCQHLGAGLVTRGVRQKRNDPDCSDSAVRCRSRARRPGVHPPLHEILKNYLMWDSISLFTDGRHVPRPVPPFTLPPLHRLIHHPVRRN